MPCPTLLRLEGLQSCGGSDTRIRSILCFAIFNVMCSKYSMSVLGTGTGLSSMLSGSKDHIAFQNSFCKQISFLEAMLPKLKILLIFDLPYLHVPHPERNSSLPIFQLPLGYGPMLGQHLLSALN